MQKGQGLEELPFGLVADASCALAAVSWSPAKPILITREPSPAVAVIYRHTQHTTLKFSLICFMISLYSTAFPRPCLCTWARTRASTKVLVNILVC